MKLDKVANSGNDEFFTPIPPIKAIMKYIPLGSTIWCPFDTKESNFYKLFNGGGYNVITSHINEGKDFFTTEMPQCDYIISNPPYSCKGKVLKRLFELNKPFAMLVGYVGLYESQERFNMFAQNNFEIMYFNKRISYFKDYNEPKPSLNPPFSSVFVCHNVLPTEKVFEILEDNKKQDKNQLKMF